VPSLKTGIITTICKKIEVYIENLRTRHSSVGNCFAISSSAALEKQDLAGKKKVSKGVIFRVTKEPLFVPKNVPFSVIIDAFTKRNWRYAPKTSFLDPFKAEAPCQKKSRF
jgi:hypothetical protein